MNEEINFEKENQIINRPNLNCISLPRELDLSNFYDETKLKNNLSNIKKILFYRICGTGMGAAAILAKECGFEILGCDKEFFPPMSNYLENNLIQTFNNSEFNQAMLEGVDLIVVGNSVPRNSEDAILIEQSNIPFTSFPLLIGELVLKNKQVIGVSGTHGKTTTSYFLVQILQNLGFDPGYLIGGILDKGAPAKLGKDKYFVIESDEYDSAYFQKKSKFHFYKITDLILTSLEFDHADIFESIEDIENEFKELIGTIKGENILNSKYDSILKIQEELKIDFPVFYNETFTILEENRSGTVFEINLGKVNMKMKTNIFGKHNIENICACLNYLFTQGIKIYDLKLAVKNLSLVKRRQEIRGKFKNAIFIDDFAHHPTAIAKTIEAIKSQFISEKIIAIYEPISATARSNIFQNDYVSCFENADEIVLLDSSLATTAKKANNLDFNLLVQNLNHKNKIVELISDLSCLIDYIEKNAQKGVVFLIMSNRTSLGLWKSEFAKNIK